MSDEDFRYAFEGTTNFADKLEERLKTFPEEWNPEVLAYLQNIITLARFTSDIIKEAECLYSGDIGEERFIQNMVKIRKKHEHS